MPVRQFAVWFGLLWGLTGCGGSSSTPPAETTSSTTASPASPSQTPTAAPAPAPKPLPRISLGQSTTAQDGAAAITDAAQLQEYSRKDVLAAMKPMQILRDTWNAVRQRSVGMQDAGEEWTWLWDLRSNRNQPALVMSSPDSQYLREARLTYDPAKSQFEMTAIDVEGKERHFTGDYSEPVQEIQGEDNRTHRIYKLQLTQTDAADPRDQWQVVLNQQENNRFLFEMSRQRSGKFQRFETISNQRRGTSFALNDSDYGNRECVISGGLGTIAVSHAGKTYYVCCTGCQAAFNDEPARWIAEFEAKKKMAN